MNIIAKKNKLLLGLSLLCGVTTSASAYKAHDNPIKFEAWQHPNESSPKALSKLSYTINEMEFSDDQNKGVDGKGTGKIKSGKHDSIITIRDIPEIERLTHGNSKYYYRATLPITAGRVLTSDTASWLIDRGYDKHSFTRGYPNRLNYAFDGTLEFTFWNKDYRFKNIVLGLGKSGVAHLWKIGGPNCEWRENSDTVTCTGEVRNNGIWETTQLSFGHKYDISAKNGGRFRIKFPYSTFCYYNATSKEKDILWYNLLKNKQLASREPIKESIKPFSSLCIDTDIQTNFNLLLDPASSFYSFEQNKSSSNSDISAYDLANKLYLQKGNNTNVVMSYNDVNSLPHNPDSWMSDIKSDTTLNELIMPGSHDAGVSKGNLKTCEIGILDKGWVETQRFNIKRQAEAGSRYFDIRVGLDTVTKNNELTRVLSTYHGDAGLRCAGEHIEDILDDAIQFLKNNPTETLIFNFSHPANNVNLNSLKELIMSNKYSQYLYKNDNGDDLDKTKLSKLKGKMIAVFFNDKPHDGFEELADPSVGIWTLNFYDKYSDTNDYNVMAYNQLEKLKENKEFDGLHVLSWTLTGWANLQKTNIRPLANTANGHLPHILRDIDNGKIDGHIPNIIYIDYLNDIMTASIINLNSHNWKQDTN